MANDKRDIHVYKGPLILIDYKWNLKNWDGDLLVTQYFMVTSDGKAKKSVGHCMGRYTLIKDIVMIYRKGERTPVFKNDKDHFLYLSSLGVWCVSKTVGEEICKLSQKRDGVGFSVLPSKTLPWKYASRKNDGSWMDDDNTLKVFPCFC